MRPRRDDAAPRQSYSPQPVGEIRELRPRGYYLAHEAGRLAGVSGDRIGQWARRGYIRASVSTEIPHVYSYQDVAEAMVVHELDLRHVPLRQIKRAIKLLRQEFGDWPLTEAPIATATLDVPEGAFTDLVLGHADGGYTDLNRMPRAGVFALGDVRRIARDLRRGGWAVRELPDLKSIEVDPDRLSGRPAIRGTRVPAELVAGLARTGRPQDAANRLRDQRPSNGRRAALVAGGREADRSGLRVWHQMRRSSSTRLSASG